MFNFWGEMVLQPENTWNIIRTYRDDLLSKSDWTQLQDVALTDTEKLAWAEYRQALRNLPQIYATPDWEVWPEREEA